MAGIQSNRLLGHLDDNRLVARIQGHDATARLAFSVLIHRYRGRLLRRCQARLGNRHDAEDALQETMLRAYRGLDGFRGEAGVGTWLTAIVDTQCASLAQRRARQIIDGHLRGLIELHEHVRQPRPLPDADASRLVQRALARAPRRDREILRLRFFQERTLEEISGLLDIGLSATKMRLYRALERLEAHLDNPLASGSARARAT